MVPILEDFSGWEMNVTEERIYNVYPSPYLQTFSGAQESILSMAGRYDNPIWRTGPTWNRFLGSLNVYKFGLWLFLKRMGGSYRGF